MTGRPDVFCAEIADRICERIADGESLRAICVAEDMPHRSRVFRWLGDPALAGFAAQYARAREAAADADADDIGHYARAAAAGEIPAASARAAIDALKWSAARRQPWKYGDKLALTGGGEADEPLQVVVRQFTLAPEPDEAPDGDDD